MSYKVMVKTFGESEYVGNGLRFGSEEEAQNYANDLRRRWTLVEMFHIDESDEGVNCTFDGILEMDKY